MSVNDFANGSEKDFRDFLRLSYHSSKNMDSFQGSVFYLDKSVMECNFPELVVCYKESTYHVVKDICVDEGVPTKDKFLFDSGIDEKFLPSEKDLDTELVQEKLEIDKSLDDVSGFPEKNQSGKDINSECGSKKKFDADTCIQDVTLPEENESNKGIPNQCDSKDLMLTREMKDDATKMIADDASKEFTPGKLLSMLEMTAVKSEAMCPSSSKKEVTVTAPVASGVEESNNSSEEAILSASASVSAAEESDSRKGEANLIGPVQASASEEYASRGLVNKVSDNGKSESGRITFDFDPSAPTSSKDERCHNLDQEPFETRSTPKLEDPVDQPFSNNLQRGNGESSFSAPGPVTALITYSGPIAYSGSLSLRSDSSTTSTRSFAFPILRSEWNSSPVRMAKADQRHYRKHRGWKQGLLCCRF